MEKKKSILVESFMKAKKARGRYKIVSCVSCGEIWSTSKENVRVVNYCVSCSSEHS